jgi:hypothetical protein
MRIESGRPCTGGGWIHQLGNGTRRAVSMMRCLSIAIPRADLGSMAQRWSADLTNDRLQSFAAMLGVEVVALTALEIGWTGTAWSFPMVDADRQVVGIRLRAPGGRKFAVRGGKEGVFMPAGFPLGGQLLLVEGPTDAAAALGLGFDVIGRPSCTGGARYCASLARGRDIVIVADADDPGRRGAEALASAILPTVRSLRVVEPTDGSKDLREWLRQGLTREQLLSHIESWPPRGIRLRIRR